MSEEVNAIINNLCDKFGVTVELLIPALARYYIATNIVGMIISLIIFCVAVRFIPKAWKYDHREDRGFCDDSMWVIVPSVVTFFSGLGFLSCTITIVGWIASPTAATIAMILEKL